MRSEDKFLAIMFAAWAIVMGVYAVADAIGGRSRYELCIVHHSPKECGK